MHAAHLPQLIKEYYNVSHLEWETNYHGMHILTNNPFIDKLHFVDVNKMTYNRMAKNLEWARHTFDMVFDFSNTIEKAYCTNENDWRYYTSDSWRRENLGKMSYYDVMTKAAGLPSSYFGTRGKLYYDECDHMDAMRWITAKKMEYGVDYVILVNLSGSTPHKKFMQAESVSRKILDKWENSLIVLTGDEHCASQVFEHERVLSKVDKTTKKPWNFRTAALMCKYMDLTISLETGIALIAHSWDAPTLQLLTAASWDNHVKYAKNAWWLQAPAPCSPCHKNPREYFGCPVLEKMPACVWFNEDLIMEKVNDALQSSSVVPKT